MTKSEELKTQKSNTVQHTELYKVM